MSYFDTAAQLSVGKKFHESYGFGDGEDFEVLTSPIISTVNLEKEIGIRRRIEWKARAITSGREVDFGITEGLEHYGPKIYKLGF